jgi:hypothetical protein
MKYIKLTLAVLTTALIAGCVTSVRDNVPATQITGSLGGQPFSFTGPKGLTMSNFVAEATSTSNGVTHVSVTIGSVSASVDPAIITMTGEAYGKMRAADSALLNSAISTVAGAAGTLSGSAAAAGITGK